MTSEPATFHTTGHTLHPPHAARPRRVQAMATIMLPPLVLIGCVLLAWEVLVGVLALPHWLLPPPSKIATTLLNDLHVLRAHAATTLLETVAGFGLALVVGFALALAIDASALLRRALYPLLVASQTIPIVAVAPLLVIGLGFGLLPKIIVVALVTFFPIVITTVDGLRTTDTDMEQLFRAMNAGRLQTLWRLRLPSALPSIFSGLKVSVTYSIIGAVLAEWIGASNGIGVYIARSLRSFRTDQVFVAILATSLLTVGLFLGVAALERWLMPWHSHRSHKTV